MEDNDESEAGYGKPPKHSRFQKGRSGNPGGRPKKRKTTFPLAVSDAMDECVTVMVRGRPKKFTKKELIVTQLVEKAARGDKKAFKQLLMLRDNVEQYGDLTPVVITLTETEHLGILGELPYSGNGTDG